MMRGRSSARILKVERMFSRIFWARSFSEGGTPFSWTKTMDEPPLSSTKSKSQPLKASSTAVRMQDSSFLDRSFMVCIIANGFYKSQVRLRLFDRTERHMV